MFICQSETTCGLVKCVCDWGFAPHPTGGAYDTAPDPRIQYSFQEYALRKWTKIKWLHEGETAYLGLSQMENEI